MFAYSVAPMSYTFMALVAAVGILLFYSIWHARWHRPSQQLERIAEDVVAERTPSSFLVTGPAWFDRISTHMEEVFRRNRRLSQQLSESDFNLNAIMGTIVESVMVVDERHVIRLVNREFLELFKLERSPLHKTVLEAIREAPVEMIVSSTLRSGESQTRQVSLKFQPTTGKAMQLEIRSVPIRDQSGRVNGVVVVFHDVSRLKELEAVRREFVANVSHELRTPLSIFSGYLETLLDQPDISKEDSDRILRTMQRHSHRLNDLVNDLLMLARLESGRIQPTAVTINLNSFLRQVVSDFQAKKEAKDVTIVLSVPENLPCLEVDPLRMEQVMFNLLENALTYSKPPRIFEIRAEEEGKNVVIRVRDNGVGIPSNELGRIFERFYRVDKGRSRELGGTGLGLSIVKHIVQIHGGSVSAESELGKWTSIVLRLPSTMPSIETELEDAPPSTELASKE
ncbi:MAG: sensor histidine kinase [Candidatus Methylacidiphilales bacterium]|nr:ATP-binding protein [Candidatus Methylacidiphilales bacterium]